MVSSISVRAGLYARPDVPWVKINMVFDPALRSKLSRIARGKSAEAFPAVTLSPVCEISPQGLVELRISDFEGICKSNPHGEFLTRDLPVTSLIPEGLRLLSRLEGIARKLECDPCRMLFVDLETTGLCGTPLFLIGSLRMCGGELIVRQQFARDYSEEMSVLYDFSQLAGECDTLVTFNGQTFDLPYLRDRCAHHRVGLDLRHRHLDVLIHARRKWRGRMPNCRLQTLESAICGRHRTGDIPGHLIPTVYHEYVRHKDITPLLPVFHHNALDLITTLELALELFGD